MLSLWTATWQSAGVLSVCGTYSSAMGKVGLLRIMHSQDTTYTTLYYTSNMY